MGQATDVARVVGREVGCWACLWTLGVLLEVEHVVRGCTSRQAVGVSVDVGLAVRRWTRG